MANEIAAQQVIDSAYAMRYPLSRSYAYPGDDEYAATFPYLGQAEATGQATDASMKIRDAIALMRESVISLEELIPWWNRYISHYSLVTCVIKYGVEKCDPEWYVKKNNMLIATVEEQENSIVQLSASLPEDEGRQMRVAAHDLARKFYLAASMVGEHIGKSESISDVTLKKVGLAKRTIDDAFSSIDSLVRTGTAAMADITAIMGQAAKTATEFPTWAKTAVGGGLIILILNSVLGLGLLRELK